MGLKTPLYDKHIEAGARIVDFGGWDMPVNYGSQKEEHHAVRTRAGMFDVSHMTIVDLEGDRCRDFLRYLLANDVARVSDPGKALYTCMLNEAGGVIDDLIVYFFDPSNYRLVVNAPDARRRPTNPTKGLRRRTRRLSARLCCLRPQNLGTGPKPPKPANPNPQKLLPQTARHTRLSQATPFTSLPAETAPQLTG